MAGGRNYHSFEDRLQALKDYVELVRNGEKVYAAHFCKDRGYSSTMLSNFVAAHFKTTLNAIRQSKHEPQPWEVGDYGVPDDVSDYNPQVGQRRAVWGGNDPNNWRWTEGYQEKRARLGE